MSLFDVGGAPICFSPLALAYVEHFGSAFVPEIRGESFDLHQSSLRLDGSIRQELTYIVHFRMYTSLCVCAILVFTLKMLIPVALSLLRGVYMLFWKRLVVGIALSAMLGAVFVSCADQSTPDGREPVHDGMSSMECGVGYLEKSPEEQVKQDDAAEQVVDVPQTPDKGIESTVEDVTETVSERDRPDEPAREVVSSDGGLVESFPERIVEKAPEQNVVEKQVQDTTPPSCQTTITYGSTWMKPAGRTSYVDVVKDRVTWDGKCTVDSSGNGYATLSNGWKPYFKGKTCVIALQYKGSCNGPKNCVTRVTYGGAWMHGPNHSAQYDDAGGVVTWDGKCINDGSDSYAILSNGWKPYFKGKNACQFSFRYAGCGGLYANPVYPTNCPDPGVLKDGARYYMSCTSGNYRYPIYTSTDLVHWTKKTTAFTTASNPSWASKDFWAPELHKIGNRYLIYYSARRKVNGVFAIGVGWSTKPLGPYKDIGKPLITEPAPGVIDAHYFKASNGKHYVLWKVDGNAVGKSTPIKIQELAKDGLSVIGKPKTILRNTLSWEGSLVEGAWMIQQGGYFYLFYSANGYASSRYAVGVARATSPMGTYQKKGAPILVSKGSWAGPGHGSVVKGPSGSWVHVYHSWYSGKIKQSPGRVVLVDRLQFSGGWPLMRSAPSSLSQPLP